MNCFFGYLFGWWREPDVRHIVDLARKDQSGPKIINMTLETSLKSQASDWLKWRPANQMLEISVWSPVLVLCCWAPDSLMVTMSLRNVSSSPLTSANKSLTTLDTLLPSTVSSVAHFRIVIKIRQTSSLIFVDGKLNAYDCFADRVLTNIRRLL
jgi:hypothetical protein